MVPELTSAWKPEQAPQATVMKTTRTIGKRKRPGSASGFVKAGDLIWNPPKARPIPAATSEA